jgi:hypothetical protein
VEAKESLNCSTFHAPTHAYASVYSLMMMMMMMMMTTMIMIMIMMTMTTTTLQDRNMSE